MELNSVTIAELDKDSLIHYIEGKIGVISNNWFNFSIEQLRTILMYMIIKEEKCQ